MGGGGLVGRLKAVDDDDDDDYFVIVSEVKVVRGQFFDFALAIKTHQRVGRGYQLKLWIFLVVMRQWTVAQRVFTVEAQFCCAWKEYVLYMFRCSSASDGPIHTIDLVDAKVQRIGNSK